MSSAGSPSAYLLWTMLSIMFFIFLLTHLWSYDRFQCVLWNSGRQPGAFKRVMTYSYIGTVPLFIIYSVSMTTLKYMEGYLVLPGVPNETVNSYQIIPKPVFLWSGDHSEWLLPVYFILAICWSLEFITHLEELTFWLYLMHQGPQKRDWFHSWEFRVWYLGSMVIFLGLFCTTVISRKNLETCPAWIFTVGSSADTGVTIAFLYVIARFPAFIRNIKEEGGTPDVVVRLTTFYQLNFARVVFRFLFTIPLLAVGLDGIQGSHEHIIRHSFLSDFLLMIGGVGCFVSSAMTLMIFFPRSVTREQGYKVKLSTPHRSIEKAPTHDVQGLHVPVTPFLVPMSPIEPLSPSLSRVPPFQFPAEPSTSTSSTLPPNSRFYHNDEGHLVEASPEYQEEGEPLRDEEYDEADCSALSHETQTCESDGMARPPHRLEGSHPSYVSHSYRGASSASPHPPPTPPPPIVTPSSSLHRHSTEPHFLQRSVTNSPMSRRPDGSTPLPRWRQTPRTESNLHPFVQTFTSPIDLLDNSLDDLALKAHL